MNRIEHVSRGEHRYVIKDKKNTGESEVVGNIVLEGRDNKSDSTQLATRITSRF